ncbi:MAG: peroxide stress protein YaaA [Rhizorhabdus sp.]|uniref:peroxide stress protein YaaA n=1 Tax=Rhizorhabdus sp. TaxID=1968843 RepID=UPI001B44B678|nr:peroxide stress protein YaaA [Rhizorhabdus sp.]MBP8234640.1 peroxide stress protein YaaA [Rhizorhabdus sp.]
MLLLLSPAKSLDYSTPLPDVEPTVPRFADEALATAEAASRLGPKKLAKLMSISDKLAQLNADRYADFAGQEERPALFAFSGDVYVGLEARTLDAPAIRYAQDHVRILSGLYGLLKPLDRIRPYRLEMGTRWAPGRTRNLYAMWGSKVSDALAADLLAEGSDTIINCASKEYWHVVEQAPPKGVRIVTIDFRENSPKGLVFNSFGAKRARGMMARWMCEHHIGRPEDLKGFDSDGYAFVAADSDEQIWRFVRQR